MATTHTSPQVCRPHTFHAPIPWLSEPKLAPSGSPWGSSFVCPQEPQDKVSQIQSSSSGGGGGHQASSGQHLFSFPPTPPKDSTPDSVQTGPTEYQVSIGVIYSVQHVTHSRYLSLSNPSKAAVNAFMHQAQAQSTTSVSASETNCGMDVKPSLSNGNGGNNGGQPKQREGTHSLNSSSSGGTGSNTGASQGGAQGSNGGLFDVAGQNHPAYNGYENYGQGDYQNSHQGQGGNAFQTSSGGSAKMSAAMSSPHSKPQRTKSRTNAGKTRS